MKTWLIFFSLFFPSMLIGQTLDECRRLAREHYPEIRQYDLVRLTEQYDLSNAARSWLPQLSLSAQATWQNEVPQFPDAFSGIFAQTGVSIPGLDKDQYKVAVELNQTIWDGGQSSAVRKQVEAEAEEQRRLTDVDLYAVEGRVDNLYFGILLLDERIVQTELQMALLEKNGDKIRSLVRNGVAMQADADAIEAERLSVGQQLTGLEATRDSYRRMLELFVGQSVSGELVRPEAIEPQSMESARPELAWFEAQRHALAARELSVKSATRPRFGLFAQGYYGYPGMDYFASMMASDWSWNALVGVRMSWNFGAYYTRKNRLRKLQTAQRQVDIQQDIFRFNTDLQVVEEQGDIIRLRRAVADDDRIVALRESVREAAESQLRNGVIDISDLLRKITEEATARSARSAHEIELLKTIYELRHVLNR